MGEGFLFQNAIDLGCETRLSGNAIASITQQVTHKSI
jgi:predicted TPR repeat methyltransferase